MKKTLLLTSLMCLLLSAFPALADTYKYAAPTSKDWNAVKTEMEKMNTEAGVAVANQAEGSSLENVTWYLTHTMLKGTFPSINCDNTKGLQFGTGANPAGTLDLTIAGIPGEITSVVVNTSGAKDTNAELTVKVGGADFNAGEDAKVSVTSTATEYTFTGVGSGSLILSYTQSSEKAIYIKSIEVTFDPDSGVQKEEASVEWGETPASINKGETLDLASLLTVTPEAAAADVTYSTSDEAIASIEGSILTANKRGSVSVTAYITGSETYMDTPRVSFTLNVLDPDATFKVYKELTSLDNVGKGLDVIIVDKNLTHVMGNNVGNNINAIEMAPEADGTYKVYDDDELVGRLTLEKAGTVVKTEEAEGDEEPATTEVAVYSFKLGESGYLYAASSSSNYLKTEEELTDNGKAAISFIESEVEGEPETLNVTTSVVFQGENTRNILQYNGSSKLFSCYVNPQTDIKIFAVEPEIPVIEAPVIAPEGGEVKLGQLVTLTCATEDAEISYKLGDGEFVAYTEPFALNEVGEITVTAVAKVDDYSSEETTATFTVSKLDVTLSWDVTEARYVKKAGGDVDFVAPVLTVNPEEVASEVTYSSSVPSVATVDADGNINAITNGITVITASFAGNDTYNAAEPASYTLTIDIKHGVSMIGADGSDVKLYDINGRSINAKDIQPGLYIIRENGKSRKVIVK